jgi:hypothetical protein
LGSLLLNDFKTIVGGDPYSLSLEHTKADGIIGGNDYTFRYRASNQVGAGEWSDVSTHRAAGKPDAPGKPTYISSDATSVSLAFDQTAGNGGAKLMSYTLYRDAGNSVGSIGVHVVGYNGGDA